MTDAASNRASERRAGLLLIAAAVVALIAANSAAADFYHALLDAKVGPYLPGSGRLSVHHWVADGLMAIFFLLVGLEIKREWYEGRLSNAEARRLPILAAGAGMAVPALVYLIVTGFDPALRNGWAIPAATDIAFAIGVLALLGERATPALKLLLVAIAIVDDVGAVLIIALVYTNSLNSTAIAIAVLIFGVLGALNLFGVRRLWPYLVGFALLWLAMLASGIHPTIAGVLAALAIPLGRGEARSPLKRLEHRLHPWTMFGIMPLFGLASAGVEIAGLDALLAPLSLGVLVGLFLGKQIGIFGAVWLAVRAGIAQLPKGAGWLHIYGLALLCGIGFTMSLFIGALAFPDSPAAVADAKIGTLGGSFVSALPGWAVLRFAPPVVAEDDDDSEAAELFGADQPDEA